MIHLHQGYLDSMKTAEGLRTALDLAIRLEHATIPPYLYALFSIKPGTNTKIAEVLHGIASEEMLHMCLACNLYNAVSEVPPRINYAGFVPSYPGPLPGDVQQGLQVGLVPVSLELIRDTFMVIEEPEHSFRVEGTPIPHAPRRAPDQPTITIGTFYEGILNSLKDLGPDIFVKDGYRQLHGTYLGWRYGKDIAGVYDLASAEHAINVILSQGEGNKFTPVDVDQNFSHYYRFAEIVKQTELLPDITAKSGWSYCGLPIDFDPSGVFPLRSNPKSADLPPGTHERSYSDHFNFTYTKLLALLERCFAGEPRFFRAAFGLMSTLRLQADSLIKTTVELGENAGPSFEYFPALTAAH